MWNDFEDPDNKKGMYAADMFHASGKGHALFAAAWENVLDTMISRAEPAINARLESSGSLT
jgi:lysophospholipase L1-like esterase